MQISSGATDRDERPMKDGRVLCQFQTVARCMADGSRKAQVRSLTGRSAEKGEDRAIHRLRHRAFG
jgi:hypothetical protein